MHTITYKLIRSARYLILAAVPFSVLNCSSSDPDSSGDGGGTSTSTGTESPSSSSTGAGATSSTGEPATTTAGTGGDGAGGSTGDTGGGGAGGSAGDGGGDVSSGEFTLTSPSHAEGAKFADKYTCQTAGFMGSVLPELHWTPGPPGTKSYAITFIDVTLTTRMPPNQNGYHWVLYNIPADVTSLPEAFKDAASIGAKQNNNYLGPCPNFGTTNHTNTDTYEFTIYALDTESITISPTTGTAAAKDAETKLEAKHLDKAKLTGTSDAASTR